MAPSAKTADIGLIGLAVMGENLVLNMESHGFTVAVFNRTTSQGRCVRRGASQGQEDRRHAHGRRAGRVRSKRPRKIMIMVKAGRRSIDVINELVPLLEPGDILIDGGNSHFPDSTRRTRELEGQGAALHRHGRLRRRGRALKGPSIMPGGDPDAWPHVKPIFQAIAAKVADGTPCCDWVGPEGAGHFVKMVHNGIEYGDMQLICEAYHLLRQSLGMEPTAIHDVFARWNKGPLDSYLIEITRDILGFIDPETGKPMVDLILDAAGQKGTGKWTVISACDLGVPLTLIAEAVFARCLSAQKDERVAASKVLKGPTRTSSGRPRRRSIDDIEQALYASKIISYAQGFALMDAMARGIEVGDQQRRRGPDVARRLHHPKRVPGQDQGSVRPRTQADEPAARPLLSRRDRAAASSAGAGRPSRRYRRDPRPGHDGRPGLLRRLPVRIAARQPAPSPARLFRRPPTSTFDRPRGQFFHTNWTGRGGTTASSTYNV